MNYPSHRTTICGHCGVGTPVHVGSECAGCGAPLRLLEPLAVDCGWCFASNRRDLVEACQRCGGPLPKMPGNHPGREPPPTPRRLPAGYENRIKYWKNVYVLIGIIFSIAFCWTIIFPIIGIPMWIMGHGRARRTLQALVHGAPTRGRILGVELDRSQSINNRHPWRITYELDLPDGSRRRCHAEAWDRAITAWQPGHVLWIVYDPQDPRTSAIWPPVH